MSDAVRRLPPGSTIGMLGGGQLGRMAAMAAARLGYRMHVYSPDFDSPAGQVSAVQTVADYNDWDSLDCFLQTVNVVTLEWENIPVETINFLTERLPVYPGAHVLEVAQDRLSEKDFVNSLGIATAPYRSCSSPDEIAATLEAVGGRGILKSTRMGYDGKGQVRIEGEFDPADVWQRMGGSMGVMEGIVPFTHEISVVAVRGQDGAMVTYPAVENHHRDGILHTTHAPARIDPAVAAEADRIARRITEALDVIGVLAVEVFVTADGRVLVNEMAPRPHNSGHWTIDACGCSQFEQQVRAVCGLPLGSVDRIADAVMTNLIGNEANDWEQLIADPEIRLHLYGKGESRPGRKMGHITRLVPRTT